MIYLIMAFSWWAILLYKKNLENQKLAVTLSNYDNSIKIEEVIQQFDKQKKMIIGEGLVFALSIIASLILINRAFWKEIELNKNFNNFLLSVTHELKTPLATIGLINKTLSTKDISRVQQVELLATAKEETSRLESLVNNILTAAQMEHSYVYNFEDIRLDALIDERISRCKKIYNDHEFQYNCDSEVKAQIDREAFVKLLDNILNNAVKYSAKGTLVITSLVQNDKEIIISFKDQGKGISDIDKKRVMKKFYRIGSEDTRESKGTGLGLFIVREIIHAHKGKMAIKDNSPKGTIIEIILNTE